METILKPFVSRFAQPIILSFCIAWIFWNWEIVVGLIWYDKESLQLYGYCNYRDLIYHKANVYRNYIYPGIIALFYPLLRYALNWFNTVIRTAERTKLLNVSGTGKMSTLKFLELKKSYDEKVAALSEYFEEQSEIQKRANESDTELIKTKQELASIQEIVSRYQQEATVERESNHDSQMALREKNNELKIINERLDESEKLNVRMNKLYYNLENQVIEYHSKSQIDFISGEYDLKLFNKSISVNDPIEHVTCYINKRNDEAEIIFNSTVIGKISNYIYNINGDKFSFIIEYTSESETQRYNLLTDRKLTFSILNDNTLYISEFTNNAIDYRLELHKI